jgi:hypothetical protein
MPSLAVSPPPAQRTGRQLLIDGDYVDLRITEKPVYDILPGRPEAASMTIPSSTRMATGISRTRACSK